MTHRVGRTAVRVGHTARYVRRRTAAGARVWTRLTRATRPTRIRVRSIRPTIRATTTGSDAAGGSADRAGRSWEGPDAAGVKAIGPARLYNRLVKAGIGPDHWQMHATREVLVSRLLSKEGRKDFDLDLLLEHAHCAARLAPNHPHFIRLASLVEEVFKTNREVVEAEQYWTWTIDLLREAIHPDVLFWNTEFKGLPPGRVDR